MDRVTELYLEETKYCPVQVKSLSNAIVSRMSGQVRSNLIPEASLRVLQKFIDLQGKIRSLCLKQLAFIP